MTKREALKILIEYNNWRRGNESPMTIANMNTGKIGQAIEKAIELMRAKK